MHTAVARLAEIGGGQVAVLDGACLAEVPLPLAGLMSDASAAEVAGPDRDAQPRRRSSGWGRRWTSRSCSSRSSPCRVIPQLRLTDGGLVDVDRFEYVPVHVR